MNREDMTREQLLEIVRKLPVTADGVPIVSGMMLYILHHEPRCISEREAVAPYGQVAVLVRIPAIGGAGAGNAHYLAKDVYSTRESAEAARNQRGAANA